MYNAEQIGGCLTVITTSKAKIMIDYGLPLPGAKAEQEDFDWEHDTVDYLITEGTMMGDRIEEDVKTEEKMQEEAKNIFRENKYVFWLFHLQILIP